MAAALSLYSRGSKGQLKIEVEMAVFIYQIAKRRLPAYLFRSASFSQYRLRLASRHPEPVADKLCRL